MQRRSDSNGKTFQQRGRDFGDHGNSSAKTSSRPPRNSSSADPPPRQNSNRVQVDRLLHSARQEHFAETTRQQKLKENRRLRDEETKRMETYRKLCEREGIESQRLKEYDSKKQQNSEQLEAALKEIDTANKMTNKERKQAKFRLKRKASERTTEMAPAVRSVGQVLAQKALREAATKEELQAAKEKEIQERIAQKDEKLKVRKNKAKAFALRTNKGQPIMAGRVRNLLDKIMKG